MNIVCNFKLGDDETSQISSKVVSVLEIIENKNILKILVIQIEARYLILDFIQTCNK